MGRPKGAKNKYSKLNKQSSKVYPVRLYLDLQEFVDAKENKNEYFNMLVRKDMERYKRKQAKEVGLILDGMDERRNINKMEESYMGKRYYVSTCDYAGNYDGLLNDNSKGFETDSLNEAMNVYNTEVSYLNSTYEMSESDGIGYYCSIFDRENECVVEMSNNYEV